MEWGNALSLFSEMICLLFMGCALKIMNIIKFKNLKLHCFLFYGFVVPIIFKNDLSLFQNAPLLQNNSLFVNAAQMAVHLKPI